MRIVDTVSRTTAGVLLAILSAYPTYAMDASLDARMSASDTQTNTVLSCTLDFRRITASAGYSLSRIRGTTDTITSFDLGATVNAGRVFAVSIGMALYPESNNYRSSEFNTGIDARFPLVARSLNTNVGVRLAVTAHSQRIPLWSGRLSDPLVLNQRSLTFSIGQELPFNLRVQADILNYSYDRDLRQTADFAYVFRAPGVFGMISGFPESGRAFSMGWTATDFLYVSYNYTHFLYPLLDDTTDSHSLSLTFSAGNWVLGVGVSQQRASYDAGIPLKYGEVSVGYRL
jgi:hypothetical protein